MSLARRRAPMRVPYEAADFPSGSVRNTKSHLDVSWDEILWAALTVGRPNIHAVFDYGAASLHEALFRISAVRLAVEQRVHWDPRLRRTDAFRRLDPTEKGAVSYFLGMTFCKVFASRMLNTPWLLHLDVFKDQVGAMLHERSRPDLIGQNASTGDWYSFESKGRSSPPTTGDKDNAKGQASRIASVDGQAPALHIASFTFLRSEELEFYWRDPEPLGEPIVISDTEGAWRWHYEPVTMLWRAAASDAADAPDAEARVKSLEDVDLGVAIHPKIARALENDDWSTARKIALGMQQELRELSYEPDGVAIRTGPSWTLPFRSDEQPFG
ncbi:conserved hypothetical protein [Phenylobacterium zucineum HLK1]|uniref:Uncharacterized protein n=2 Tax=Phenylobacterium zucineum TaxID=284016 RepID=B4RHD5_PHEZH|nr:conserved hypothetical protein [Phenylobacterium zucineum HLK1]